MSVRSLVTFTKLPSGPLRISLDETERAEVEEIYHHPGWSADDKLSEVLEYEICNSDWEFVSPIEIGALTERPILSEQVERDNQGNITHLGRVYHYEDYQVFDPVERLLTNGHVDFQYES
jgi:hypothetical protein